MHSAKPIYCVKIHEHPESPHMVWRVGQEVNFNGKKQKISEIEKDENHHREFGVLVISIYVGNEIWKEYPYSVVTGIDYDQTD